MCSSPTSQKCSTCEDITYCSKTCEKADWHVHQLICKKPVPVRYDPYGRCPNNYTAVIFPENEQALRYIEFSGRDRYSGYGDDYYHPARQLLGSKFPPTFTITSNVLRTRSRSGDQIELYYLAKTSTDIELNRSIAYATGGRVVQLWRGPVIAVKLATPVSSPPQYLNMNALDLRDVVDQLCAFPVVNISDMTNPWTAPAPKVEVTAVRINCPGDQSLGRPKFELLNIRGDHAACSAPITAISQLVQFPLRVIRCSASYDSQFDVGPHTLNNPDATFLNIGVNPASSWGFVGLDWIDPAGTVIVVRADGAPLSPQHLEAMCHWCLFVLKPLFDDSRSMGLHPEVPMSKDLVLARIGKSEFERFYVGFDEWKGSVDDCWKKAQWPFC